MICIQGDRITLKSFSREEYHEHCKSYVADPVMDPNLYIYNKENVDKKYDTFVEKESWYPRVGIFLPEGIPIGELTFKRIDYEKSQCEIGIAIVNDQYKGKGYGTEALKLAIDYVFYTLKLKTIYADTMGSNLRMQKIFMKFGFKYIDKKERFYDMKDRWEDKLNFILISPQNN